MQEKLDYLCEVVHSYMKKSDNYGRTVTLKAKMPDFRIITRSKTFGTELRDLEQLQKIVSQLLLENTENIPVVRLLGVSVSNLSREQGVEGIQLEFDFNE